MTKVTVLLIRHGETQAEAVKRARTGSGSSTDAVKLTKLQKIDPSLTSTGFSQAQATLAALVQACSNTDRRLAVFSAPTRACTSSALMLSAAGVSATPSLSFGLCLQTKGPTTVPIVVLNGLANGQPEIDFVGDVKACIDKGYLSCAAAKYNTSASDTSPFLGVVHEIKETAAPTVNAVSVVDEAQYLCLREEMDPSSLAAMTPCIQLRASKYSATKQTYATPPKIKSNTTKIFNENLWKSGAQPSIHRACWLARQVGCDTIMIVVSGPALQRMVEVAKCDDYIDTPPGCITSFTVDLEDGDETGRIMGWNFHGVYTLEQLQENPQTALPEFPGVVRPVGETAAPVQAPAAKLDNAKKKALEEYKRMAKLEFNRANGIEEPLEPETPPPAPATTPTSLKRSSSHSIGKARKPTNEPETSPVPAPSSPLKRISSHSIGKLSATSQNSSMDSSVSSQHSMDSGELKSAATKPKKESPTNKKKSQELSSSSHHSMDSSELKPAASSKKKAGNKKTKKPTRSKSFDTGMEDAKRVHSSSQTSMNSSGSELDKKKTATKPRAKKTPARSKSLDLDKKKPPGRSNSLDSLGAILDAGKKMNSANGDNVPQDKPKKFASIGDKIQKDRDRTQRERELQKEQKRQEGRQKKVQQTLSMSDQEGMKWLETDLYSDFDRESSSSSDADSDSFWSSVASSIAGSSNYNNDSNPELSMSSGCDQGDDREQAEKKRTRRPLDFLKNMGGSKSKQ